MRYFLVVFAYGTEMIGVALGIYSTSSEMKRPTFLSINKADSLEARRKSVGTQGSLLQDSGKFNMLDKAVLNYPPIVPRGNSKINKIPKVNNQASKTDSQNTIVLNDSNCTGKLQRRGQCISRSNQSSNQSSNQRSRRIDLIQPIAREGPTQGPTQGGLTQGTFHVRRPSQSPPREQRGAKGAFEIHGPGEIEARFSDSTWRTYAVNEAEKKTVYVSDKKSFHARIQSGPPGKHTATLVGADAELVSMSSSKGRTMAQTRGPAGFRSLVTGEPNIIGTLKASTNDRPVDVSLALPGNPVYMGINADGPSFNTVDVAATTPKKSNT